MTEDQHFTPEAVQASVEYARNVQELRNAADLLDCRYCGAKILHDGKHWAKFDGTYAKDFQDLQGRRTCPSAPAMVRFHVPKSVEVHQHTRCIPEG